MALILFTRSRAPLVKTSRSLKNEFRKGKCSYQFVTAVCWCACNAYRGVMTLAVSTLASRGDQTEPGRFRLHGPVRFQEEGGR